MQIQSLFTTNIKQLIDPKFSPQFNTFFRSHKMS